MLDLTHFLTHIWHNKDMKKFLISIIFLSSCTEANFPNNVSPFDNQEKLLKECIDDMLCGEYSYETGMGETGDVKLFKYKDAYFLHYTRDDKIEYAGIGVLSGNYFAVTYIYGGFSDVGTTHYEIKNGDLYGFWTCVNCDGRVISENLYKKY